MITTHLSRNESPTERGARFGRAHADAINRTARFYERLFANVRGLDTREIDALGSKVAQNLGHYAPGLLAEIEAMAEAANLPTERLAAINARTEILSGAAAPECSVVGVDSSREAFGQPLLAQNWDWHPDASPSLVLWTIENDHRAMTTLTEAGILAKIGCNSRSIAVCLNILGSSADGGVDGMPIHLMLRLLLQECDNWDEVVNSIAANSFSASSAISVATASQMATFELSPHGAQVIAPTEGLLTHTNHFLRLPEGLTDTYLQTWPDTVDRLDDVTSRLRARTGLTTEDLKEALRSHDAGRISVCCHDPNNPRYSHRQATLASIIVNVEKQQLEVLLGHPCQNEYEAWRVTGSRS